MTNYQPMTSTVRQELLNHSFSTQVSDKEENKLIRTSNFKDLSNIPKPVNAVPEMLYENKKRARSSLPDINSEEISDGNIADKSKYGRVLFHKNQIPKKQVKSSSKQPERLSEADEKRLKAKERRQKLEEEKNSVKYKSKETLPQEERLEKLKEYSKSIKESNTANLRKKQKNQKEIGDTYDSNFNDNVISGGYNTQLNNNAHASTAAHELKNTCPEFETNLQNIDVIDHSEQYQGKNPGSSKEQKNRLSLKSNHSNSERFDGQVKKNSKDSENEDRPKKNDFLENKKVKYNNYLSGNSADTENYGTNLGDKHNYQTSGTFIKQTSQTISDPNIKSEIAKKLTSSKSELMEFLIKNFEKAKIKQVQKEVETKSKQLNEKNLRKLKYLNEHNKLEALFNEEDANMEEKPDESIDPMDLESNQAKEICNDEDNETDKNPENENSYEKIEKASLLDDPEQYKDEDQDINDENNNSNDKNISENENYNMSENQGKIQESKKPKVDQFGFLRMIQEERKLIAMEDEKDSQHEDRERARAENTNLQDLEDENNITDSFRRAPKSKSLTSKNSNYNNIQMADDRTAQVFDQDGNYLFSYKTNRRSKPELHKYMLEKREKERQQKIRIDEEQKKEFLNKFVQVIKIEEKQRAISEQIARRKQNNQNSNSRVSNQNSSKRRKVRNDYYIGKKDDSSIIDQDEYKLAMYELRMIFNSGDNISAISKNRASSNNPNDDHVDTNENLSIPGKNSKTSNYMNNNKKTSDGQYRDFFNSTGPKKDSKESNSQNNRTRSYASNLRPDSNKSGKSASSNTNKYPIRPAKQIPGKSGLENTAKFENIDRAIESKDDFVNFLNEKKQKSLRSLGNSYNELGSVKSTPEVNNPQQERSGSQGFNQNKNFESSNISNLDKKMLDIKNKVDSALTKVQKYTESNKEKSPVGEVGDVKKSGESQESNIIIYRQSESPQATNREKIETQKKIEEILNKSKSREQSDNQNISKRNNSIVKEESSETRKRHELNSMDQIEDDSKPRKPSTDMVIDNKESEENFEKLNINYDKAKSDKSKKKDLVLSSLNSDEPQEVDSQKDDDEYHYIDINNLDQDSAAIILQNFMKSVYLKKMQMYYNEIEAQEELPNESRQNYNESFEQPGLHVSERLNESYPDDLDEAKDEFDRKFEKFMQGNFKSSKNEKPEKAEHSDRHSSEIIKKVDISDPGEMERGLYNSNDNDGEKIINQSNLHQENQENEDEPEEKYIIDPELNAKNRKSRSIDHNLENAHEVPYDDDRKSMSIQSITQDRHEESMDQRGNNSYDRENEKTLKDDSDIKVEDINNRQNSNSMRSSNKQDEHGKLTDESNGSNRKSKSQNSSNKKHLNLQQRLKDKVPGKLNISNASMRSYISRTINNLSESYYGFTHGENLSSRNSSIIICPNSLDSPKLHRIHELIAQQKEAQAQESNSKLNEYGGNSELYQDEEENNINELDANADEEKKINCSTLSIEASNKKSKGEIDDDIKIEDKGDTEGNAERRENSQRFSNEILDMESPKEKDNQEFVDINEEPSSRKSLDDQEKYNRPSIQEIDNSRENRPSDDILHEYDVKPFKQHVDDQSEPVQDDDIYLLDSSIRDSKPVCSSSHRGQEGFYKPDDGEKAEEKQGEAQGKKTIEIKDDQEDSNQVNEDKSSKIDTATKANQADQPETSQAEDKLKSISDSTFIQPKDYSSRRSQPSRQRNVNSPEESEINQPAKGIGTGNNSLRESKFSNIDINAFEDKAIAEVNQPENQNNISESEIYEGKFDKYDGSSNNFGVSSIPDDKADSKTNTNYKEILDIGAKPLDKPKEDYLNSRLSDDISKSKDISDIEWLNSNSMKIRQTEAEKPKRTDLSEDDQNEYNDFEKGDLDINYGSKEKEDIIEINIDEEIESKPHKQISSEQKENTEGNITESEIKEEIIKTEDQNKDNRADDRSTEKPLEKSADGDNINQGDVQLEESPRIDEDLAESLTDELLNRILDEEIRSRKQLFPKKNFRSDVNMSFSSQSNLVDISSLSIMSNNK